jgi:hypothetical protein
LFGTHHDLIGGVTTHAAIHDGDVEHALEMRGPRAVIVDIVPAIGD